ncbi:MAG: hypothetical protein KKF46_05875 [Nanoarchaeota archaeon]|nr:hypothetical protein [Nanoarchaeota archaeon]MBU1321861.1 hypothetical protein [Nanoarchaeota archaeon]MBU1597206.1 hypothetical protein [Nanoarchaeota archaeon]MBU2441905.1 hypothetical protein [Nanoarchaeota archaeon]
MKEKNKSTLVEVLGAIGIVILLIGIFTKMFFTGLIIALVIWIIVGILTTHWKIKKFWGIHHKKKKK